MPPRPRNRLGSALKKGISTMLVTSLLVSQQGFSFYEAFAQTVESGQAAAAAGNGGVGAVGAGASLQNPVSPVQLTLGAQSLGGPMSVLPGVQSPSLSLTPAGATPLPAAPAVRAEGPGSAGAPETVLPAAAAPVKAEAARTRSVIAAAVPAALSAQARPAGLALAPSVIPQASRAPGSAASQAASAAGKSAVPGKAAEPARAGLADLHKPASAEAALGKLFDGQGRTAPSEFRPGEVKAFLTRAGKDPVAADLGSLREVLASDPDYVKSLNSAGRVRLIVNESNPQGGLKSADLAKVRSVLEDYGIKAKIEVENIPVDWARKDAQAKSGSVDQPGQGGAEGPVQGKRSAWWRYLVGPVTAPFREAAYLARTLAASLTKPTWSEVVGGIVSKAPGVVLGLAWWAKLFLPTNPAAFGAALALTLALNVFHGIWINSWSNFQSNIGRQRGVGYQTMFNLFYMSLTGVLFRLIAWSVVPGTVPPWSLTYWRDMGIASVVGTFFGTLGFQGLNGLYDKGRVPRAGRSAVQQLRDLFFTLGGTFFGTGSMLIYWTLFLFQQGLDIGIYAFSRYVKTRPIVYLADSSIAATGEFQGMYPVQPGERPSPLKQALQALLDSPMVRPIATLAKWVYRKLTGKGGTDGTSAPNAAPELSAAQTPAAAPETPSASASAQPASANRSRAPPVGTALSSVRAKGAGLDARLSRPGTSEPAAVSGTPAKPQGIEELEPNKPGLGKRVQARLRRAVGWDGQPPVEDPLIGEKIDVTPWLADMLKSDDPEVVDRLLAIFPQLWDKPLDEPAEAPTTLAEVSLTPEPGRQYTPSPEDWRDEIFYSIFVDRFARGGEVKAWGDAKSGQTWHGGNVQGVIDKLDYLKGLGVTTIMLTSLVMSAPGGYHGYWPVHMMAVDPHYGSMEDYRRLVAEAHRRGMRVVMDLAVNHVGKVFTYEDNNHWGPVRRVVRWLRRFKPLELSQEEHFYRRGVIANWDDPDQALRGDFPPDLRHFNVENPGTQDLLVKMAKWWIKETDIDGFRLDAYRHMHPSFWAKFHGEVREYAAGLGKTDFLQLGELSVGLDGDLAGHLGPGKLDSAFAYPAYRKDNAALHGFDATRRLEESFWSAVNTLGESAKRLLRFIDNHDTYRFMREGTPAGIFKVGLAYLLFSTGIPMVYAGTEQAVRQAIETMAPEGPALPADPHNREDLFAQGQFKSRFTQGEVLQAGTQAYEQFRRLAELRSGLAPLRRGEQYVRWSDPNGAGIFAFSRIYQGQEILVVMNTAGEHREAEMWVDGGLTPAGTHLGDALDGGFGTAPYAVPGGGSKVKVSVPAHGVRVLVRRSQ